MIGRLLAAKRAREKQKVDISVQQLNAEQQQKEKIQEAIAKKKESKASGSIGCSILFAISCILFIIAVIILIPALVYGDRVFFLGFGIFAASAFACVVIGCCFNDCFVKKTLNEEDEENVDIEEGDFDDAMESKDRAVLTDSGISLMSKNDRDDVPWNLPVRLGSPNKNDNNNCIRISYNNLPTVVST